MPIYRVYAEKKNEFAVEALSLLNEIKQFLKINLRELRILNLYDVENMDYAAFESAIYDVFAERQLDNVYNAEVSTGKLNAVYLRELQHEYIIFAVESLPGQFDMRSDSASSCLEMLFGIERPLVRCAKVYLLKGDISQDDINKIKRYVINPVESREVEYDRESGAETLLLRKRELVSSPPVPEGAYNIENFTQADSEGLRSVINQFNLSLDYNDLKCIQDYYKTKNRNPTNVELKLFDTYWSDHCRHTTFNTIIDSVEIEDGEINEAFELYKRVRDELNRSYKPVTLMDMATIGARYLKERGLISNVDESDEINACTVKINVNVREINGKEWEKQKWLLLFKNETHNHPTEIEPFGGAATCIGGAIRDPLSGRAYVFQAMRISGSGDPRRPIEETLSGKLSQRKIALGSAAGNSSYGNQIGLATGLVREFYHERFLAKHMELGAVLGAVPRSAVVREKPVPGDVVLLVGGKTGRDGIGGASGSSRSHTSDSVAHSGGEVQKGNAPEERKLQRLFRNAEAARLVKKCNDFGAGGAAVAVGELADGLEIRLDRIPKKYDGLSAVELAISESQERMAVVVAQENAERFIRAANDENISAEAIAEVTDTNSLVMKFNGDVVVDISRDFLNTNGAPRHTRVKIEEYDKHIELPLQKTLNEKHSLRDKLNVLCNDLNFCSQKGLAERFDSSIQSGAVLFPFGGKYRDTPSQCAASLIPMPDANHETDTTSLFAYGYDPYLMELNPFMGAYNAVYESVAKIVAAGGSLSECYLSFQEYFEKLKSDGVKWGKPFAALLGALKAQLELGIPAIGGKDSMSGSFENLSVPPVLASFAVSVTDVDNVVSNEFKLPSSNVALVDMKTAEALIKAKKVLSSYAIEGVGIAGGVFKMALGNRIGIKFDPTVNIDELFSLNSGKILLELKQDEPPDELMPRKKIIGSTINEFKIIYKDESINLSELKAVYDAPLDSVYPAQTKKECDDIETISIVTISSENKPLVVHSKIRFAKPRVFIPVFPGTNCEIDTERAFARAGAVPQIFIVKNASREDCISSIREAGALIKNSEIIFIPGGFSAGDEPEGSAKFITAFFKSGLLREAVSDLLDGRGGLIGGACNGFQALVKLGLLPYGRITVTKETDPTLTFNKIGRHVSKIVYTRVSSTLSPWFSGSEVGDIHAVPVSHGEGRFIAGREVLEALKQNGQIATQYVDMDGIPRADSDVNPAGSTWAIEGITSPDGRVMGKMGHSERHTDTTYKNVYGNYESGIFENAVRYFN